MTLNNEELSIRNTCETCGEVYYTVIAALTLIDHESVEQLKLNAYKKHVTEIREIEAPYDPVHNEAQ